MTARWTTPDGDFRLLNARLPGALTDGQADAEGFVTRDLWLIGGRVTFAGPALPAVDLKGGIVLPAFVDCHTHLDKGHIWPRTPNPDGTFMGALNAVAADREASWSAEDVRARMTFSLRSAWAHGTQAIRTHLDSLGKQTAISWGVFREVRAEWAGRITLQAAALTPCEMVGEAEFEQVAAETARSGGVLGTVTYPVPDLDARLDHFFRLAERLGLHADFHVDETQDPESKTLRAVAEAVIRTGYKGRVLCGHCCSLARQPDDDARRTMDLVAEAGLSVVSLPMCNMYLQDREGGRTPRSRGITLVHELAARGVKVAFASDNTRDPFYAYGDMDMLEVLREATRIAHLDHPFGDWPQSFGARPAAAMGLDLGRIADGGPADLVAFPARRWTELLARPWPDRLVIRNGRAVTDAAPDYAELDPLFEKTPEPA
jgi:cytosine deaminase